MAVMLLAVLACSFLAKRIEVAKLYTTSIATATACFAEWPGPGCNKERIHVLVVKESKTKKIRRKD